MLKPENRDKLRAILTYHVLPNEILATTVTRLKNNAILSTVNGARITIRRRNGVKINDAMYAASVQPSNLHNFIIESLRN